MKKVTHPLFYPPSIQFRIGLSLFRNYRKIVASFFKTDDVLKGFDIFSGKKPIATVRDIFVGIRSVKY